jgi:hypothetical protein
VRRVRFPQARQVGVGAGRDGEALLPTTYAPLVTGPSAVLIIVCYPLTSSALQRCSPNSQNPEAPEMVAKLRHCRPVDAGAVQSNLDIPLLSRSYDGRSAMHSISTSASNGFCLTAMVVRLGLCP